MSACDNLKIKLLGTLPVYSEYLSEWLEKGQDGGSACGVLDGGSERNPDGSRGTRADPRPGLQTGGFKAQEDVGLSVSS